MFNSVGIGKMCFFVNPPILSVVINVQLRRSWEDVAFVNPPILSVVINVLLSRSWEYVAFVNPLRKKKACFIY